MQVIEEIKEIKEDIFKSKPIDENFKLLSELLMNLRQTKNIKALLICRQIEKVIIETNQVIICAAEDILNEIFNNKEIKQSLNNFFNTKNLSIKEQIKNIKYDKESELKRWLGDKIIIK